ncbi:MAG: putative Ig domain-containing protein, partial [Planctomycetota bacterium]
MTLDLPDAGPSATATLQITVTPTSGNLDPAPVGISTQDNTGISPTSAIDNAHGSLASVTVVDLSEGTYTLTVADGATTGDYTLEVALLGDVDADDMAVTDREELLASAALTQAQGTGNFVTALFYQSRGINFNEDQYDVGMDSNANGRVDPHELTLIQQNMSVGSVLVDLVPDSADPVISNLQLDNDTGVSDTDGITTDPQLSADIEDESAIDQILVSIDGGDEVNVIDQLGAVDGSFTLTQEILDSVAGGTLADGEHTVAINAVDAFGNSTDNPTTITFTFIRDNAAPVGDTIGTQTAPEDSAFSFDTNSFFSDPNTGDAFTLSQTGLPAWATFANGVITGTPGNDDVGSSSVTITATDSQGATGSSTFTLVVENVNDDPVVSDIPDQNVGIGDDFSLDILAFVSDIDVGDEVAVSVDQFFEEVGGIPVPENLPDWLSYDEVTGILSGTPGDGDSGMVMIVVNAVDSADGADFNTFTINVSNPPVLVTPIPDQNIDEDAAFSLDLNDFFSDPDGDTLVFDVTQTNGQPLPSWLTLSPSGILSGTPDNDDVGGLTLEATAVDPQTFSASDTFSITVANVNDAPTMDPQSFEVPSDVSNGDVIGTIVADDVDAGDVLTFSVDGGTGESVFAVDSSTGEITVIDATAAMNSSSFTLIVTVTDLAGASDTETMTLNTQGSDNMSPIAGDDQLQTLNNESVLTILVSDLLANDSDPDNDTLSITSVNPSVLGATVTLSEDGSTITYDPTTSSTLMNLTGTTPVSDSFLYELSDGRGGTDNGIVAVNVTAGIIEFTTSFENLDGDVVTEVNTGDSFVLVLSVQDVRGDSAAGVFSDYADINYDGALVEVDGTFEFSTTYGAGNSGSTATFGLLDEVGGTDGISPLGGDVFEVMRIQMRAVAPGTATFTGDLADDTILHPVTVFDIAAAQPESEVLYSSSDLVITGSSAAPLGFSETVPGTNVDNAYDVNADGYVSPIDVLMLLGELSGGNESYAGILYTDVNADGYTTPIDALMVIGQLGTESAPRAAMSGGVSSADLSDSVFEELGDESEEVATANYPLNAYGSQDGGERDHDESHEEVDEALEELNEFGL